MHSRSSYLEDSIREAVYVQLSSRFALVRSGNHSKPHKIGWLQQRRFISSTEAGKSKIRTLEDYATVASLFLTLRWPLSPHPHRECGHTPKRARMYTSKPLMLLLTETNPVRIGSHSYHLTKV